jgi:hypothetical protein
VSKKAEVVINGKAGKLDGLVAGQKAEIDYEATLEIVTKIEATGEVSAYFRTVAITIGVDGKCQLTIDNKASTTSPKTDGKEIELAAFKNADVQELKDGRLRILHDFSKFRDLDALKASFLPTEAKSRFEDIVSIDEDDGLLVLIPDDNKSASFVYPRAVTATIETTIDIATFNEGLIQFEFATIGPRRLLVLLSGDGSRSGEAGTVSVVWAEQSKRTTLLKFQASKSGVIKQEFELPTDFDVSGQRFTFRIGLGSEVPCAFKSLEISASVPPSYGVALGARGNRVIVNRIIAGSAGEAAKLKRGDILFSVNGTEIKSTEGAMKALGESGLGKKATWVIERFGKKRTIVVIPN